MHFGGFLTKSENGTAKHLSGKDVMDEIVAKSKMQKVRFWLILLLRSSAMVKEHTLKQSFVSANLNDPHRKFSDHIAHRFHTIFVVVENTHFCNRAFPG